MYIYKKYKHIYIHTVCIYAYIYICKIIYICVYLNVYYQYVCSFIVWFINISKFTTIYNWEAPPSTVRLLTIKKFGCLAFIYCQIPSSKLT